GYSKELADDLVQEVLLRLCENNFSALRRFEGNDPQVLGYYLRAIACNTVQDYFRSRRSSKRGSGKEHSLVEDTDGLVEPHGPATALSPIEKEILINQIDHCLKSAPKKDVTSRDRSIFWMYFRHGMSAKAISELPAIRLSSKGVESALQRL